MKFYVLAATLAAVHTQQIGDLVPDFGEAPTYGKTHHDAKKTKKVEPICPHLKPEDKLDDFTYSRKMLRTIYESALRGWFHDQRALQLDEKCFGDWMETKKSEIMVVFDKLNAGDIWGLKKKEVEASLMAGVDTFYTNLDHCSPYLFAYDTYRWCMNDPITCNYQDGVLDRLVGHGFPLVNDVIQMVNELNKDTQCMPDQDQIEIVGNVIYTMSDFMSTIIGFEG